MITVGIAIAALMFSAATARAELEPRVELLSKVSVAGTRVFLSDLLPVSAPSSLCAVAAEISLGAAPQPGSIRILGRDAVERGLGANSETLARLDIPERIVVSRDTRPITLAEVFGAVRGALKVAGAAAWDTLRPVDISFESLVLVGPGDPGLRVMSMDLDRDLGSARFLLWPSRDPKVLPFFVTARRGGKLLSAPVHSEMNPDHLVEDGPAPAVSPRGARQGLQQEILVARGERATLTLSSDALRMFVDVVSLEQGAMGQQVRVRILDGGKVFSAVVDGRAHVEATF
jgi:Chaperone for flagella basal body P-ring formation